MLKKAIRGNLESAINYTLVAYGADETLAFDVAKQCVSDEDVDKCLETMLEHVSKEELELFETLIKSDLYHRYTQAVTESMRQIDSKIKDTLNLLNNSAGRG